jgi:hypothetical protein
MPPDFGVGFTDKGSVVLNLQRGEWFGSRATLAKALDLDKRTLAKSLDALAAIGAVEIQNVERQQRYKKRTVNGSENAPMNGAKNDPQGYGNCTDVRCLGTLVKVRGWKWFQLSKASTSNGTKNPPQVSTTVARTAAPYAPRLTQAQRALNDHAAAAVRSGAL